MKSPKLIIRRRFRSSVARLSFLRFRIVKSSIWKRICEKEFWRKIATVLFYLAGGAFILVIAILYLAGVYTAYVLAQKTFSHEWSEIADIEAAKVFFPTLIAVIGGPVLIWRVITSHIQAKAAQHQAETSRHGHYTDLFARAVEQLGATREVIETIELRMEPPLPPERQTVTTTEPNLEVRLGAIYSLERVARDSDCDHWPIMEVLCAYIRNPQNCGHPSSRPNKADDARKWPLSIPPTRLDIQAAIKVIGRRDTRRIDYERRSDLKLDFRKANLQKAIFDGGDFSETLFNEAHLEGASFLTCKLRGGSFIETKLTAATLDNSNLQNANFFSAKLDNANLNYCSLESTNFRKAWLWQAIFGASKLHAANFDESTGNQVKFTLADLTSASFRKARLKLSIFEAATLENADFQFAEINGSNFKFANLDGTDLFSCAIKGASFSNAKMNGTNLDKSDCSSANFFESSVSDASFEETNLSGALLFRCNLSNAYFL
jgi:uncharacterized protein YjbI with pentapeptide repeats